jgi:hypothetical protein
MKKAPLLSLVGGIVMVVSCSQTPGVSPDPGGNEPRKIAYIDTLAHSVPFVHDGMIHKQSDFDRIKRNLEKEPWKSGYSRLTSNAHAQLSYAPNPVVKLIRGGNSAEEPQADNYSRAFRDVAAAYQLALRYKISGDRAYAERAVLILNAWASTCTSLSGNSNVALGAGIYGYQFAIVGELLREYEGWKREDFKAFQTWMLQVFYPINRAFLTTHWGTCASHYWANWDLANLASVLAIGVLTDRRDIYNYGVNYLQRGLGNGNILKAVYRVHPDGLGQMQESGRDQGHATLCIALLGVLCEIAWTQGDDFYGFDDHRILKAAEYTAKYNVAKLSVPFDPYTWGSGTNCQQNTHSSISDDGRGSVRPMYELIYNHYEKRKGLTATYSEMGARTSRPEGGGGDYGPNSGGYDQLGFGTLMYTID